MPDVTEVLTHARTRAEEPVRVRVTWADLLTGFVVGFLAAVVPAVFVTRMLASQLPLASAVLHGSTARVFALFLAMSVGAATAVCRAARKGA